MSIKIISIQLMLYISLARSALLKDTGSDSSNTNSNIGHEVDANYNQYWYFMHNDATRYPFLMLHTTMSYGQTLTDFQKDEAYWKSITWPGNITPAMRNRWELDTWHLNLIDTATWNNVAAGGVYPNDPTGAAPARITSPLLLATDDTKADRVARICYTYTDIPTYMGTVAGAGGVSMGPIAYFNPGTAGTIAGNSRLVGRCNNDSVWPGWNENAWKIYYYSNLSKLTDDDDKEFDPMCKSCAPINEFWIMWNPIERTGVAIWFPSIIGQISFWISNNNYSYLIWYGVMFVGMYWYGMRILRWIGRWLPFRENYDIPILDELGPKQRGRPKKS